MKTVAEQIHPARYREIRDMILALTEGDPKKAVSISDTIIGRLPAAPTASEDIQTLFFVEAIHKRLDEHAPDVGNLYLMPDQGQQIKMFNFMAEKFPLVRLTQQMVNTAYCKEVQGEQDVVIVDIGIGSGQQMARLIEQASSQDETAKNYTIIGIEPATESLASAKALLEDLATKKKLNLQFQGISKALEALSEAEWQNLEETIRNAPGKLIVNASFALHHVRPTDFRAELFKRIKRLNPAIFSIIEPYADFLTANLPERFNNAWHHYGLTFGAIDQIDATVEEKNTVKKIFFSREIQDVLSEDHQRVEQFETGEMWLDRLLKAGFSPYPVEWISPPDLSSCPFVTFAQDNGYFAFNVQGFPIVSILIVR